MSVLKNLGDNMSDFWGNLSDKDRRILTFASPIILILVLYLLVLQPVMSRFNAVKTQHDELSESLVWLYENAALVERMSNQCSRKRLVGRGDTDLSGYVESISQRAGANVEVNLLNSRELDLQVNTVTGARAISLLQSYACHGFSLSQLDMSRQNPTANQVRIDVRLTASGAVQG